MATMLSEFELDGAAAVCGGGVVMDVLPSGLTGAAHSGKGIDCMLAFAQNL